MKGGFFYKLKSQLKWKIMGPVLIGFIIVFAVLVLMAISISSREISLMGANKGRTLSDITAENVKTSLMFEDKESCKGSLNNLKKDRSVVLAQVFDKNKKPVAQAFNQDLIVKKEIDKNYSFDTNQLNDIGKNGSSIKISEVEIAGQKCQFFSSKIIKDDTKETLGYINIALSLETLEAATSKISYSMLLISVIALALIGILSSLMISRMVKPLIDASNLMAELSAGEGDLTLRLNVNTEDEIGKLGGNFNSFIEKLGDIVSLVKDSSGEIYNGTKEISAGSEDLSTRTSEQAASITETSTTLEGFTSIVKINTENSEEVRKKLENFNADLQTKKDLMVNVTSTMKAIEDSSKKIDNIITVINDISFQTNLLALNAAVEAARAGEAGRGFAVVAAEVRNLAQKTAESSKTIQEIVTKNVESTKKGMLLVNETSEFFSAIMNIMGEMVTKINQITNGSKEQSTGVEQINQAIIQLENVINQNAALVEELSATSKNMSTNTRQLNELVNRFKL
ncbi:MAG: methyl-accepting chemotaxis protein [Candidatus Omnitrophota bacterium]